MGRAVIVKVAASWLILAVCCLGTADAGGILPGDPAALPAWQGTQAFSSLFPGFSYDADVDFAVYAPSTFSTSLALGFPLDPSGGSHYVYAYQATKTGGNVPISLLSIGFQDLAPEGDGIDDLELPDNIGFLAGFSSPAAAPTPNFNPDNLPATTKTSAFYEFSLAAVNDMTDILLYTSPFGPEWDRSSVAGGPLINFQALPSPEAPEPGTLTLGILAMVMFMACRVWRRRR